MFLAAMLCWIAAGLSSATAEQVVQGYGLTARIDIGADCGRSVSVSVEAPNSGAFTGDRIDLQRLLGGVRATLAEVCPALHDLEVTGYADGELALVAAVTADSGWRVPTELESRVTASPLIEAATTCDYDRDQPFVGCWVQLLPEQFSGLILNVHRDGSWFWERPKALVTGTFEHVGRSIQRDYMIGAGSFLTFTDQVGWNVNFVGPLFRDDCNILKLGPYAPLGVGMFGPTDPQLLVRLRSPQRITIDILRSSDRRFSDGYVGSPGDDEIIVSLPEGSDAFNNCVDNFDEDITNQFLLEVALLAVPPLRMEALLPTRITRSYAFERRIISEKAVSSKPTSALAEDFFEGSRYSPKASSQMYADDYHGFPESVTAFARDGIIDIIIGRDSITRTRLRISGWYKGRSGHFVFIKESNGVINHRMFEPNE